MMKYNKSGFTLVELLAVVVILAIILAVAVPSISNVLDSSKKSAFESDAKMLLKAIDLKKLETADFNPVDYNEDLEGLLLVLKLSPDNYESIAFTINGGKLLITVEGKGKWEGLTACGSYHNIKVSYDGCELDLVPPVLTILGDNPFELFVGDTYNEFGANVTDNSGETIEASIDTSALNINQAGEYTVTYTATDSSGNTTTKTRTVIIISEYDATEGVNRPRLAQGMTAIKWSGSDWVKVDNPNTDTSWYDYANKEWANAVTGDCNTPGDYDTCSMWVWIPRYAYQIASCYHLNRDQCRTSVSQDAGTINVKFLKNKSTTASDDSEVDLVPEYNLTEHRQTNFIKHPAFTFGDKELTGIWVAKFIVAASEGVKNQMANSCQYAGDNVIKTIRIIPNQLSWRCMSVNIAFAAARSMEKNGIYGWTPIPDGATLGENGIFSTESGDNPDYNGVDVHMMKNIEWGAVAYLTQSSFGQNANLEDAVSRYTGGGTDNVYLTNVDQSTTGNKYGIYDMVGGVNQYVMGNLNYTPGSSGFTPANLHDKYIDRYTGYNNTIYGDAVYETSSGTINDVNPSYSWYFNLSRSSGETWFDRGGSNQSHVYSGVFAFQLSMAGENDYLRTFRPILLVDKQL